MSEITRVLEGKRTYWQQAQYRSPRPICDVGFVVCASRFMEGRLRHSPLMLADLMIGHHFSISAFW